MKYYKKKLNSHIWLVAVTLDTSVAVSFIATNALFTTRVFHSIFIQVLGVPAYFLVIEIKYSLISMFCIDSFLFWQNESELKKIK